MHRFATATVTPFSRPLRASSQGPPIVHFSAQPEPVLSLGPPTVFLKRADVKPRSVRVSGPASRSSSEGRSVSVTSPLMRAADQRVTPICQHTSQHTSGGGGAQMRAHKSAHKLGHGSTQRAHSGYICMRIRSNAVCGVRCAVCGVRGAVCCMPGVRPRQRCRAGRDRRRVPLSICPGCGLGCRTATWPSAQPRPTPSARWRRGRCPGGPGPAIRIQQISLATLSTRIFNPHVLSERSSYDVASNLGQA